MKDRTLKILKNGRESDQTELSGLHFLDCVISAPNLIAEYEVFQGVDGDQDNGARYGPRTVTANYYFETIDGFDYELACHEVWRAFFDKEPYYIIDSVNPGMKMLVRPKPFEFSRLNLMDMKFTIEFDLFKGFRESLLTSASPKLFTEEAWQFGMNLLTADDLIYTHSTTRFLIYNPSDTVISPFQHHELDIALTCVGSPIIHNKTTGDNFEYNGRVEKSDVLLLTKVSRFLNDKPCGRETNHGVITLAKGWNEIEVTRCSNLTIAFNFSFLYF